MHTSGTTSSAAPSSSTMTTRASATFSSCWRSPRSLSHSFHGSQASPTTTSPRSSSPVRSTNFRTPFLESATSPPASIASAREFRPPSNPQAPKSATYSKQRRPSLLSLNPRTPHPTIVPTKRRTSSRASYGMPTRSGTSRPTRCATSSPPLWDTSTSPTSTRHAPPT